MYRNGLVVTESSNPVTVTAGIKPMNAGEKVTTYTPVELMVTVPIPLDELLTCPCWIIVGTKIRTEIESDILDANLNVPSCFNYDSNRERIIEPEVPSLNFNVPSCSI